jgi:hypothetical protein
MMAGNNLPIMCTLSPDRMADRRSAFEALFAADLTAVERAPLRLRLIFGDVAQARRREILELFDAEQECCAFLDFAHEVDGSELRVTVTAPAEAGSTLDGFQTLAERNTSPRIVVQDRTGR